MPASVPEVLAAWMRPFRGYFTTAVWRHVLVLVAGACSPRGGARSRRRCASWAWARRRASPSTIASSAMARWSSRAVAHRLLLLLVAAFVPDGRWWSASTTPSSGAGGPGSEARGIYRDPVRSSHGHFVKASGLRWLCVMLLAPVPWAGCVWGAAVPDRAGALRALRRAARPAASRSSPTGPARRCCRPRAGCPDGAWSRWPTAASPPSPCCATSRRTCA